MRIAAVGDVHLGVECVGTIRPHYADVAENADVLLLAGDLTHVGSAEEATVVAGELGGLGVPTFAVLGNHDHHAEQSETVISILEGAGIRVLEGAGAIVEANGERLGVAGAKGFGGGFAGACASEFGEPLMKAFIRHTKEVAAGLRRALDGLAADWTVALLHYAPTDSTLQGEPVGIHAFLGSYLLGEAVDGELGSGRPADLVLHGHAHRGVERGVTAGGVRVRNVAQPVIRRPYRVYCLGAGDVECAPSPLHASAR